MQRVVIVGSKGFIGGHAYAWFSGQAHAYECWGCDVSVDYTDPRYMLVDATNPDFGEIFRDHSFDLCINCSGAASVPDSLQNPLRDFTLNVLNVARLLDAIRRFSPACRFVTLSSAAVYGSPSQLPIAESSHCRPVSPYGEHKLMAEALCRQYASYFGVAACSVRIFSAYGPGLRKQLLWDICRKASQSDTVSLFGTGNESRDFIYVADVVSAIECVVRNGQFVGEAYNAANGQEVTVRTLAETLLARLGYGGRLEFRGEVRAGDPVNWRADTSLLESCGYSQQVDLDNGVERYVRWFKEDTSR